jgi:hypothetical protein
VKNTPEPGTDATSTTIDGTRSIPKPRRKLYVASLVAAFAVTAVLSLFTGDIDRVLARKGVGGLKIPAEVTAVVGRLLRDPVWLGVAVAAVVFLALLALKGLLDRILRILIGLNFLWLAVFLLMSLTTWMAFFRISEKAKPGGP